MIYGIVLFDTEDENEIEHVAIAKSTQKQEYHILKVLSSYSWNHGYAKVCNL